MQRFPTLPADNRKILIALADVLSAPPLPSLPLADPACGSATHFVAANGARLLLPAAIAHMVPWVAALPPRDLSTLRAALAALAVSSDARCPPTTYRCERAGLHLDPAPTGALPLINASIPAWAAATCPAVARGMAASQAALALSRASASSAAAAAAPPPVLGGLETEFMASYKFSPCPPASSCSPTSPTSPSAMGPPRLPWAVLQSATAPFVTTTRAHFAPPEASESDGAWAAAAAAARGCVRGAALSASVGRCAPAYMAPVVAGELPPVGAAKRDVGKMTLGELRREREWHGGALRVT